MMVVRLVLMLLEFVRSALIVTTWACFSKKYNRSTHQLTLMLAFSIEMTML